MSMDQTNLSQPVLPTLRLKMAASAARLALWLVLAFWVLFGIAWAVLHGWIVPRIGEFRPRIELAASQALGVPVRIGQISARSGSLIPSFELRDVALLDARGEEALRLPRVMAAVSPSSLWGLGFEQLSIDQPELDIRRTADGKIYVAGLDVSQNRSDGRSAIVDWFFSQTEVLIRGGTVRWSDDLRQVPVLALTQVDATLRNPGRRHLMRLDATPPAAWGERFSLRGVLREPLWSGGPGQWQHWAGQLYAEFSRVDVSEVKRYAGLDKLGIDLKAGNGALRAWADVNDGQITGGTADVALLEVDAQLGRALQPLALQAVTGRFGGKQFANGFDFATEGLQFRTRDGLRWPGGNAAIVYTGAEGKTLARGDFKADKLDLAALALIANRLPLGSVTHAAIAALAPKGLVDVVEASWQGALDAPSAFSAKGRVTQLEIASKAALPAATGAPGTTPPPAIGRPGVRGAAVDFDLTQQGGQAKVRIVNGEIHLPGIFEDPRLLLDQFSTDAQWKRGGPKIDLQLRNIMFANADAQGTAQASWHTAEAAVPDAAGTARDRRFPGVLDVQGALSRGDGSKVHRYLPLILPERTRDYVRNAVTQGALTEVKFKIKGNLRDMPFSDPKQGEFRVSARVANASFAYVPKSVQPRESSPWPALTELRGELVFDRASLQVNGASGRVAGFSGLQLVKAEARIPDLMHSATVQVQAELKGPLGEALGFVNTSPLDNMTGNALAKAVATGVADYKIQLSLPLGAIDKSRVQGTVSLPGNDVQFTPDTPQLTSLKGLVTFTESGFAISAGQARMLGGDIRLEGGSRAPAPGAARPATGTLEFPDAAVVIRAQGTLSAEGLRQARHLGLAPRLAQSASGSTAYTASLGFRRGATELSVASNLQGMALSLPAPLNKSADTLLPVRFDNTLQRESVGAGQALQDQLSLTVGRLASVVYVRDISGPEPRVLRGSIGIGLEPGESAPVPDTGVAANINLATVDIDAWGKVLSASAAAGAPPGPTPSSRLTPASAVLGYLPTSIAIRAKELVLEGRKLHNVVLGGSRDGLTWRANIDATELNGYVEFRQAGGAGAGRLYGRLSRLSLGQNTASEVEAILNEQPANIPALDIVVEDLELRGKKLGRVEIEAINRGAGTVAREGGEREWRLNKLNVFMPEATLTATGNWVALNAQQALSVARDPAPGGSRAALERRRTVMNFRLDIADSGELLKRFGMSDVIRRGKGRLEGQIAWIGSPLSLDYPSLNGQFNVNVASGQFLKADPGIAKLLGVLSLQALPRRLTLDFRDVFSDGFFFDFVRGDVNINQGLAFTNNLQMKGINAAVLMEGSADIARETQDLRVVVVPEINAGTASLIATVINPAIGLGTFLAQYFLRRPLIQAATQEFHIDGTWADPKITKVERKPVTESKADQDTRELR